VICERGSLSSFSTIPYRVALFLNGFVLFLLMGSLFLNGLVRFFNGFTVTGTMFCEGELFMNNDL
jgi:hypothetical protein